MELQFIFSMNTITIFHLPKLSCWDIVYNISLVLFVFVTAFMYLPIQYFCLGHYKCNVFYFQSYCTQNKQNVFSILFLIAINNLTKNYQPLLLPDNSPICQSIITVYEFMKRIDYFISRIRSLIFISFWKLHTKLQWLGSKIRILVAELESY